MKKARARHILVETEKQCAELKEKILAGSDFAQIAKEHSTCPSGRRCGDLGEFSPGQMVKEFENACFNGGKGTILGPVKTQFGYQIIRIEDIK